jgi:hypothetical protein
MTPTISFGDTVRVRAEPETIKLGLAGLRGSVYGKTMPSKTGIAVIIGHLNIDYAVNVHLRERGKTFWIAPELLELIDPAPDTEIIIEDRKLIREAGGDRRE